MSIIIQAIGKPINVENTFDMEALFTSIIFFRHGKYFCITLYSINVIGISIRINIGSNITIVGMPVFASID
jgi:hypothetical protein